MAAGGGYEHLEELLCCPVCTERFTAPRHLRCGHQFCEACLRGIADRHPAGGIVCPTCRHVTKVRGDVTRLPRAVLTSQIQESLSGLGAVLAPQEAQGAEAAPDPPFPSGRCEEPGCRSQADRRCVKCSRNGCDVCITRHVRLRHETIPIYPGLFCGTHPRDVITNYCLDCEAPVCEFCLLDAHDNHEQEDIEHTAMRMRREIEKNMKERDLQYQALEEKVRARLQEIEEREHALEDDTTRVTSTLEGTLSSVAEVRQQMEDKMAAERMQLAVMLETSRDSSVSRKRLLHDATEIVRDEQVGTVAMVTKLKELLNEPDSQSFVSFDDDNVNIREWEEKFKQICSRCVEDITPVAPSISLVTKVTKVHELEFKDDHLLGLVIDRERKSVCVVKYSLLTQTDYLGNCESDCELLQYTSICDSSWDSKRNLILLRRAERNELVLLHKSLNVDRVETIRITDVRIGGVTYLKQEDIYAVTDLDQIIVIDPDKKTEVRRFGGPGTKTFSELHNMTSYDDPATGRSVIVVSDLNNDRVVELDTRGNLVNEYGNSILCFPRGVCADPSSDRIFVCDSGNRRVVTFTGGRSGGQIQMSELLTSEHLGGDRPVLVDYDPECGLMVVVTFSIFGFSDRSGGKVRYFFLP